MSRGILAGISEDSERDEATASEVLGVAMRMGRLYFYPLPEPDEPPASEVTYATYARVLLPKPLE